MAFILINNGYRVIEDSDGKLYSRFQKRFRLVTSMLVILNDGHVEVIFKKKHNTSSIWVETTG